MKRFTHAVFDFDGVVADTESVFAAFDCDLLRGVLNEAGIAEDLAPQDVRALAGNGGERKLAIIAERFEFDHLPFLDDFAQRRTEARKTLFADREVAKGQNIERFLNALKAPYALATNKSSKKLFHDMQLMGLRDMFEVIVPCDPPFEKKPAPDLLFAAMALIDAHADKSIYVGDNVLDMQAAKAAGMIPIGFIIEGTEEHETRAKDMRDAGAEIVVDDFADLIPYIEA